MSGRPANKDNGFLIKAWDFLSGSVSSSDTSETIRVVSRSIITNWKLNRELRKYLTEQQYVEFSKPPEDKTK